MPESLPGEDGIELSHHKMLITKGNAMSLAKGLQELHIRGLKVV
jgi:hypothetical protein